MRNNHMIVHAQQSDEYIFVHPPNTYTVLPCNGAALTINLWVDVAKCHRNSAGTTL